MLFFFKKKSIIIIVIIIFCLLFYNYFLRTGLQKLHYIKMIVCLSDATMCGRPTLQGSEPPGFYRGRLAAGDLRQVEPSAPGQRGQRRHDRVLQHLRVHRPWVGHRGRPVAVRETPRRLSHTGLSAEPE